MADAINPDRELLKIMSEAGCIGIKFGLESFSPKILSIIDKPVSLERARDIMEYCSEYKIKSHATFLVGLINEDIDSLGETLNTMKEIRSDSIQVSIAVPFPGTRFYNLAKSKGLIEKRSWEDYDGKGNSDIQFINQKEKSFKQYRYLFLIEWLRNRLLEPIWIFKQFFYLKSYIKTQGLGGLLKQMIDILEDDLSILFIRLYK
jgi:radical SAM superfamily enzyme YgiQ (UPF0313 family)